MTVNERFIHEGPHSLKKGIVILLLTALLTVLCSLLALWWFDLFPKALIPPKISLVAPALPPVAFSTSSQPQKKGTSVPVLQKTFIASPQSTNPDLFNSSFSDTFTGDGWIDTKNTTLYRNDLTSAFTFPPVFSWEKTSIARNVPSAALLSGTETFCIHSSCLSKDAQNILFLNNASVLLPQELRGKTISHISLGALDTLWVVGVTTHDSGKYEGIVYTFNGSEFTRGSFPVISEYDGEFGFGGADNDWIAVYGGYEGSAFRTQSSFFGGVHTTDISRFFGIRIMNGGFHPQITRIGSGKSTVWYVTSQTKENAKLIKLFQNNTNTIQGSFDYSAEIFPDTFGAHYALCDKDTGGNATLSCVVGRGSGESSFLFTDNGFQKNKAMEIVSSDLNNYKAEVRNATISELGIAPQGGKETLFLSNTAGEWDEASVGNKMNFSHSSSTHLQWRMIIYPDSDSDTSPFLDNIRIDYQVKFL